MWSGSPEFPIPLLLLLSQSLAAPVELEKVPVPCEFLFIFLVLVGCGTVLVDHAIVVPQAVGLLLRRLAIYFLVADWTSD